jgi:hypothetical protein
VNERYSFFYFWRLYHIALFREGEAVKFEELIFSEIDSSIIVNSTLLLLLC